MLSRRSQGRRLEEAPGSCRKHVRSPLATAPERRSKACRPHFHLCTCRRWSIRGSWSSAGLCFFFSPSDEPLGLTCSEVVGRRDRRAGDVLGSVASHSPLGPQQYLLVVIVSTIRMKEGPLEDVQQKRQTVGKCIQTRCVSTFDEASLVASNEGMSTKIVVVTYSALQRVDPR